MKLPDKPSDLLTLALNDLSKVEKSKMYKVNMETYPEFIDGKCHVCLAGAVMAKTLNFSPAENYWIAKGITLKISRKIAAIDFLRRGNVGMALSELGFLYLDHGLDRKIPKYGSKKFKPALRKLARDLKKAGY